MKHCPRCDCEYEDWATVCSDCEVELAEGPAPAPARPPVLDPGQFRDWVVLTNVPNVMIANVLKDQLEHAGIPVLMKRTRATDVAEWSHNDFAWQDLYVPERYVMRARRLLTSAPTRAYPTEAADEDEWEDEEEDLVEEETSSGDLPGGAPADMRSGWYLVDSAYPSVGPGSGAGQSAGPDSTQRATGSAQSALPGLSRHREGLTRRKDHVRPPDGSHVLPFRPAAERPGPGRGDDDEEYDGGTPVWTHSRIYRILIGLLFLAWTLPFLLQMLAYFRDALARFFP